MSDDVTAWQWVANAATAGVVAIGGFMFKSYAERVKALEETHKNLVSTAYFDTRLKEMTEERRWMHEQNSDRFDSLNERLDRVLNND